MCVRGVGARLVFEADMWHQGCWSGGDTAAAGEGREARTEEKGWEQLSRAIEATGHADISTRVGMLHQPLSSALKHRKQWTRSH